MKGSRGIKYIRVGTSRKMTIGKPIAATRITVSTVSDVGSERLFTDGLRDSHGGAEAH